MDIKIENGSMARNARGVPQEVGGLEELLQQARFRLTVPLGAFRYDRAFGSHLHEADLTEEHAEERLVSAANEALYRTCVTAEAAEMSADGTVVLHVRTPLGGGEVRLCLQRGENDDL